MGKKRGQFTIFIVLGIVILFSFMFMFSVASKIQNAQLTLQASKQIDEYISQNSINLYVTDCLEKVSKEAIVKAAMQGGQLDFAGKDEWVDYVVVHDDTRNVDYNVSLAITPNEECNIVAQSIPDYPYPNTKVSGTILKNLYEDNSINNCMFDDVLAYSGFFGYNKLARLCDAAGANRPAATYTAYGISSCMLGTYSNSLLANTQKELEEYISKEMPKCADFVNMKNYSSNITIDTNPVVTVVFTDTAVNVKLSYPFTVLLNNKQPVIKMVDFAVDKQIPLKQLYDYVFQLVLNDVSRADFDIVNDKDDPSLLFYYHNYNVVKKERNINGNFINLVQIIDPGNLIDEKMFIFQYAVKNRKPALDYINEVGPSLLYDIMFMSSQTVQLSPQGYDPDEDEITYTYSGWMEDYTDVYNSDGVFTDCVCASPTTMECVNTCMERVNTEPDITLTKSTKFLETRREVESQTLTGADQGLHTVRILIKDMQGLEDYQDVRILVTGMPEAIFVGYNPYTDLGDYNDDTSPRRYASYEDPYTLDGSSSIIGISSMFGNAFSSFTWEDFTEPFKQIEVYNNANNMILNIPTEITGTTCTSNDIINYPNCVFKKPDPLLESTHKINLLVDTNTRISDQESMDITVKKCLPHRERDESGNILIYSYPYNTNPDDVFQTDHTCCNEITYDYNDETQECYRKVTYGGYLAFNESDYMSGNSPPFDIPITYSPPITLSASGEPSGTYANDIFNRTFTRSCSGDRGNVCTGDAREVRDVAKNCATTPNAQRSCSGPPIFRLAVPENPLGFAFNFLQSNILPAACSNYGPVNNLFSHTQFFTFERYKRLAELTANDGRVSSTDFYSTSNLAYCNDNYKCTTGQRDNAYNGLSGVYYCKGGCDNFGNCDFAIDCKCDSSHCIANSACNDLPYPGNGATINVQCIVRSVALDTCVGCGLSSNPQECTYNPLHNCDADLICDTNNAQYSSTSLLSQSSGGTHNYLQDECFHCKVRDVPSNTCYNDGTPNSADPGCHGLHPNDAASINTYCDNTCKLQTCPNNFAYNPASHSCYASCSGYDSRCASSSYYCLNNQCVEFCTSDSDCVITDNYYCCTMALLNDDGCDDSMLGRCIYSERSELLG